MGSSTSRHRSSTVSESTSSTDGHSDTTGPASSTSSTFGRLRPNWVLILGLKQPPGYKTALFGVENDLHLILDQLSPTVIQFIVADFEITRDGQTVAKTQPTKANIEKAVRNACLVGGKGVIFYLGHGIQSPQARTSYWPSSDGEAIYGEEFLSWLRASQDPEDSITLVLDACYSASFICLPIVYRSEGEQSTNVTDPVPSFGDSQLIIIAAAQFDEQTNTFLIGGKRYGAMIRILVDHFNKGGQSSASELAKHLRWILRGVNGQIYPQQPQISARLPCGDGPMTIV